MVSGCTDCDTVVIRIHIPFFVNVEYTTFWAIMICMHKIPFQPLSAKDFAGKTVLVRVDYNVPLVEKRGKRVVGEDRRIAQSINTIQFLRSAGAKVVLISHLGRPKSPSDQQLSLRPVAEHLNKKFHIACQFVPDCVGEAVRAHIAGMRVGDIVLLENLRFYPEEKQADQAFAQQLANLAEVYVTEAFSALHRKHASTYVVPQLLPSYAGLEVQNEIATLSKLLTDPQRPLVCVIGGAKIADKVQAVQELAKKADIVLIGGGIANNFFKAEGLEIYRSFTQETIPAELGEEANFTQVARKLLDEHRHERMLKDGYIPLPKILYPFDVVAAPSIEETQRSKTKTIDLSHDMADYEESEQLVYADIGPKTTRLYTELILQAGTVFWNGPMGVWENSLFSNGTHKIACAVADAQATTILGGGDTIAAIDHFGLANEYTHISTGGGASLEYLSGGELPGLAVLSERV